MILRKDIMSISSMLDGSGQEAATVLLPGFAIIW